MRRYKVHIMIMVVGLVCLAVTWYLEPPIQLPAKAISKAPRAAAQNHYLRVMATQPLAFRELTIQVAWNGKLVGRPQVLHGKLTRKARPHIQIDKNQATITCKNWSGKPINISGKGPVARLIFRKFKNKPLPPDAVRVVSVQGITAKGVSAPVEGLALVGYQPPQPPVMTVGK